MSATRFGVMNVHDNSWWPRSFASREEAQAHLDRCKGPGTRAEIRERPPLDAELDRSIVDDLRAKLAASEARVTELQNEARSLIQAIDLAQNDRMRALKLADALKINADTCEEAVAALVEIVRAARVRADASEARAKELSPGNPEAYGLPITYRAAVEEVHEWREASEAVAICTPSGLRSILVANSSHHDRHHALEDRVWDVIGGQPEEDADPEVRELDDAVRVSLQHERDKLEEARDLLKASEAREREMREALTRITRGLSPVNEPTASSVAREALARSAGTGTEGTK